MEKLLAAFRPSSALWNGCYIPPYRVEIHSYHWMHKFSQTSSIPLPVNLMMCGLPFEFCGIDVCLLKTGLE
jgi:hypothetical protein